jgi:hypothetical protein
VLTLLTIKQESFSMSTTQEHIDTIAQSQAPSGMVPTNPHVSLNPQDSTDSRTMSRSPTITARDDVSFHNKEKGSSTGLPAESTLGKVERLKEENGEVNHTRADNALSVLSPGRKSVLMLSFCLSMVRQIPFFSFSLMVASVHRRRWCFRYIPHDRSYSQGSGHFSRQSSLGTYS